VFRTITRLEMMSMHRLREYTLIGAMMVLGVILGTVYVHTAGGQTTLTLREGTPKTVEDRTALENEAIEIALSDPRVKPLTEGKTVRIFSTFYMTFHAVFDNETLSPVKGKLFHYEWDQKYRALVTIRYTDDTGYSIHVDITDKIVEEPRKVYWKGEDFYALTP
jgi:hypothetical protein